VPASKPNIVFVLVDNVGWGDWGVYGGTTKTPRIDALAGQATRFTNYTVEAQCTPTRSAIMTGRLPVRTGCLAAPLPGQGTYGLAPFEYTLASLLSDAGYATAALGKWHLGEVEGRLPTDKGFDEWWGIKNTSDEAGYTSYAAFRAIQAAVGVESPKIWQAKKGESAQPVRDFDMSVRPYMDEMITVRASEYISRQAAAGTPFFAYVALTHMHPPEAAHPSFDQTSPERGGLYADLVAEMDYRVGQMLDAVAQAGIENNTIFVLSSDNATGGIDAVPGGSNGPWRGNFFTPPFEGSMKAPAIIRWPDRIPAGMVTDEILTAVDWYTTLASLAGETARVPDDRPVDGIDASAFLQGRSSTTGRHGVLFFGTDGQLMSVKWRHIKTILRYWEGIDKNVVKPIMPLVYDLSSDPGEVYNLMSTKLDMGWMMLPAFHLIDEYQQSVAQYPNIPTGADFTGYPKPRAKPAGPPHEAAEPTQVTPDGGQRRATAARRGTSSTRRQAAARTARRTTRAEIRTDARRAVLEAASRLQPGEVEAAAQELLATAGARSARAPRSARR